MGQFWGVILLIIHLYIRNRMERNDQVNEYIIVHARMGRLE